MNFLYNVNSFFIIVLGLIFDILKKFTVNNKFYIFKIQNYSIKL